jgi:formylglycine-generating enzyme required for sulfatase activity
VIALLAAILAMVSIPARADVTLSGTVWGGGFPGPSVEQFTTLDADGGSGSGSTGGGLGGARINIGRTQFGTTQRVACTAWASHPDPENGHSSVMPLEQSTFSFKGIELVVPASLQYRVSSCGTAFTSNGSWVTVRPFRLTAITGSIGGDGITGTLQPGTYRLEFYVGGFSAFNMPSQVPSEVAAGYDEVFKLADPGVQSVSASWILDLSPVTVPAADCDGNAVDDACQIAWGDMDGDLYLDACERDWGDLVLDGVVDGADLGALLSAWGTQAGAADLNNDGTVDGADLGTMLGHWGITPWSQPRITAVSPPEGLAAGGTTVVISGVNLAGCSQVTFDGTPGTNLNVIDAKTVSIVSPPLARGPADVRVVTSAGEATVVDAFEAFVVSVPTWADLVELLPNPAVVTDPALRERIIDVGFAWKVRDRATQIEMVLIPPGQFFQGCSASFSADCRADELPVRPVELTHAFYLGRCEVTTSQWESIMSGSGFACGGDKAIPIQEVTWYQVQEFLAQTGLRLPTEAEWEYAYRAGTSTAFHGSARTPNGSNDDFSLPEISWVYDGLEFGPQPVGLKASNGYGLHDMSGNVWEWVSDWYGAYSAGSQQNPDGPASGVNRVIRGGAWRSFSDDCRASSRRSIPPLSGWVNYCDVGFRVARTVAPRVPAWADLLQAEPDPAVVTNLELRSAILATGLAWRVQDRATGIEYVLVPQGEYLRGCSPSTGTSCAVNENPVHPVILTNSIYVGRFEVTQQQWTNVMGFNPSFHQGAGYSDASVRPVERMTWFEAQAFAAAIGARLPTEAEWEYAYRAGTSGAYHGFTDHPFGTSEEALVGQIAWLATNSGNQSRPVGQRLGNGFGLHDMSGNVYEWVSDWFSSTAYPSSAVTDPQGPANGTVKVQRGGYWNAPAGFLRASSRSSGAPSTGFPSVGLRVVRVP